MPSPPSLAPLTLGEFFQRIHREMIPVSSQVAYFSASSPLTEEDLDDYLHDPIAAVPGAVLALLPKVDLVFVPFLRRVDGKGIPPASQQVSFDRPDDDHYLRSASWWDNDEFVMAFAIDELEVGDYHYEFYHHLAKAAVARMKPESFADYELLLREELKAGTHGEVDEESWQAKQLLLERRTPARRESKVFREYVRCSLADTLTLFLHGLCCDIDVEPGPRQLQSRFLRKRLKKLQVMFPPPPGYALFPEELDQLSPDRDRTKAPLGEVEASNKSRG
jgi:hypothetical protein